METVDSSALHKRARSIAVRKECWDSGRSFKATTIFENMRATRLYGTELLEGPPLHVSGSTGNHPIVSRIGNPPLVQMGWLAGSPLAHGRGFGNSSMCSSPFRPK